jgi:predicted transglutaminase-like cysteine proteinase
VDFALIFMVFSLQPNRQAVHFVNKDECCDIESKAVDDIITWNQADYWATPLEVMGKAQADCEDFSIAKYMTLVLAGVPRERLRMIYVRAQIGGPASRVSQAHMVVGYYATSDAEPIMLDKLMLARCAGAHATGGPALMAHPAPFLEFSPCP